MNENFPHIEQDALLIKYLAGETSESENTQVQEWLDMSDLNRQHFAEMRQTWDMVETVERTDIEKVDQAWKKVQGRVRKKPARQIRLLSGWMRVAAVILVGIAIAAGLFQVFRPNPAAFRQLANTSNLPIEQLLPDASVVILEPGAVLSVPQAFADDQRFVRLNGEAFFDVEKDPKRSFIIETPKAMVEVLGTSFFVRASSDQDFTEVEVKTGRVQFSSKSETGTLPPKPLVLTAGDKAVLDHEKRTLERPEELPSPATGSFSFKKIPMMEVVSHLETRFSASFIFANEALKECIYSGDFENEKLEDILLIIESTFPFEIKKDGTTYIIDGKGC